MSCIDLSTKYIIHESFELLDSNKNGVLDQGDFRNSNPHLNELLQSIWARIIAEFDADGDKSISKDEFFLGFDDILYTIKLK